MDFSPLIKGEAHPITFFDPLLSCRGNIVLGVPPSIFTSINKRKEGREGKKGEHDISFYLIGPLFNASSASPGRLLCCHFGPGEGMIGGPVIAKAGVQYPQAADKDKINARRGDGTRNFCPIVDHAGGRQQAADLGLPQSRC